MTPASRTILRFRVVLGLLAVPVPVSAQTALFEVETRDETKLLQLYDDAGFVVAGTAGNGAIPASGTGIRLMWHPGKAAFRAGRVAGIQWDDENVGTGSIALGDDVTASGDWSVSLGRNALASGESSTALGVSTLASGFGATAMGVGTLASRSGSTAMGAGSEASGINSLAAGDVTTAAGSGSVALGTGIVASGDGSFAFGDRNISFPNTALANEFRVRAFGGVVFSSGVNIGCVLPKNGGAWACTSSRSAKEGFEPVDGEEILSQLAALPVERWRYRGSDSRHIGPTAEDFHAAFGLGDSTTRIATVDADGVALRAIQALERRTAALAEANTALRSELVVLRAENERLRNRVSAVEGKALESW